MRENYTDFSKKVLLKFIMIFLTKNIFKIFYFFVNIFNHRNSIIYHHLNSGNDYNYVAKSCNN